MKIKIFLILIFCFNISQVVKAQKIITPNVGNVKLDNIVWSNDSKYFASGFGKVVSVWDINTGRVLKSFDGYNGRDMVFSNNGKYIAYNGYNETILVNLITDKKKKINGGRSIDISSNSNYILVSSKHTYIYNISDLQKPIFKTKSNWTGACFDKESNYFYTAKGKTIIKWQIASDNSVKKNKTLSFDIKIRDIAIHPNGKYLAILGNTGKKILVWDLVNNLEIKNTELDGYIVSNRVDFIWKPKNQLVFDSYSPDSKFHIYSKNGDIYVENTENNEIVFKNLTRRLNPISDITISPNYDTLAFISMIDDFSLAKKYKQNILGILKVNENELSLNNWDWKKNNIWLYDIEYNYKYNSLYIETNGGIFEWDIQSRENVFSPKNNLGNFECLSPDCNYFVTLNLNSISIFNTNNKELHKKIDNNHISPEDYFKLSQKQRNKLPNIKKVKISNNNKYIAYTLDNKIIIEKFNTGKEVKNFTCNEDFDGVHDGIEFSKDNKYIAVLNDGSITVWNILSGSQVKKINNLGLVDGFSFSFNSNYFAYGNKNKIYVLNTSTWSEIILFEGHLSNINKLVFSNDDKFLFSSANDGSFKIWDLNKNELLLTFYSFSKTNDWCVFSPDGKFDGTEGGMKNLHFVEGMNVTPLSSLYEQYYTPNLLARILSDEELEEPEIKIDDLTLPPLVEIISPKEQGDLRGFIAVETNRLKTSSKEIEVTVQATDQDGGIDEIRLYVNGKLIETTQRGFKPVVKNNQTKTKTFTVSLSNGENIIRATAFNNQRTESIADEITVFYEGTKKTANLHLLVIGIDKYRNPEYNLNYALADATAFKEAIEKNSQSIFGSVNITFLADANATKEKITLEFDKLKTNVAQEDVFVFYYAGHGVMSVEDKPQFHIIPHGVTQLYGDNRMLQSKAISSNELESFSMELKAQKQLYIFDACQSGGMTEHIAQRGNEEEKAIALLARATGTYWFTASGSEQYATEFAELGHGVYTYAILLGLQGQADAGSKDRQITVQELDVFIKDKVPELSEKYKGQPQFPKSYGGGDNFPIIIVK